MKKPAIIIFTMFIVIGLTAFLFLRSVFQVKKTTLVDYKKPFVSHEDVTPERRDTQYMFNHLIRGEIIGYNQTTQTLSLQRDTSMLNSTEPTKIKVKKDQVIYCWPERQGPNGEYAVKDSLFTLPEGSTIFLKGETSTYLNTIKLLEGKYIFVQNDPSGVIVKIAILGCHSE